MKTRILLSQIELKLKVGVDHKMGKVDALVHCNSVRIKVDNDFKDITRLISFPMRKQLLDKALDGENFVVQTDEWEFNDCQSLEIEFIPNQEADGWHELISVTLAGHNFRPYISSRAEECIFLRLDQHIDSLKSF